MSEAVRHEILVRGNPAGARALIEVRLGIDTWTEPTGDGERWTIYFNAPGDIDLDFLRPDVLEPMDQRQ
jgi:hypothetical protein